MINDSNMRPVRAGDKLCVDEFFIAGIIKIRIWKKQLQKRKIVVRSRLVFWRAIASRE
jgi:hypothetical protein